MGESGKGGGFKLGRSLAALATLSGVLALVPTTRDAIRIAYEQVSSIGSVELPDSYPNEEWRPATEQDLAWLADEWCYTNLGGFRASYRISGTRLQQQNQPSYPDPDRTEWVDGIAHASNTGLIRIAYPDMEWPSYYIKATGKEKAAYYGNTRYSRDDGTIVSSNKMQALSCTRCTVGDYSYSCSG